MALRGFMNGLKHTAVIAFLAVATATEAPAQTSPTDPGTITNPTHPLNPLNPASPISVFDDAAPATTGTENNDKEGLMLLFSVIGAIGITAGLKHYVDGADAPPRRKPGKPRGQSFDL